MVTNYVSFLQAIEEDGTQENSHIVGTYFINKLRELQNEFDIIGDVRGKGLMIGVELVSDRVGVNLILSDMKGVYLV